MIASQRAPIFGSRKSIVVIGAGFSGSTLATHLLRAEHSSPIEISLIDPVPDFGRGVAYARSDLPYLLNVPAARMSADARDPLQFIRFAKRRDPTIDGKDFLPRELYGDYLQALLLAAERAAPPHVVLNRVVGRALRITPIYDNRFAVQLACGDTLFADDVVLATGNPPPAGLPGDEALRNHPAYAKWPSSLSADHRTWQKVLIVGSGLSMADAVMCLTTDADPLPHLQIVSRRGLVPLTQAESQPKWLPNGELLLASATTMATLTRSVRVFIRAMSEAGSDWREVMTFVRSLAPRIWASLPDDEKRRFVRHVQPYWNAHRHCLPPSVAQRIERLHSGGQMDVSAGRIESIAPQGHQIRVIWRRRGELPREELIVDAVVNATGPDYRLTATQDPLFVSLCDAGLITADAAGLGLRTDAAGALIGANNKPHPHLHYLGPMLRAEHWEATAVAELLTHASRLASQLIAPRVTRHTTYEHAELETLSAS